MTVSRWGSRRATRPDRTTPRRPALLDRDGERGVIRDVDTGPQDDVVGAFSTVERADRDGVTVLVPQPALVVGPRGCRRQSVDVELDLEPGVHRGDGGPAGGIRLELGAGQGHDRGLRLVPMTAAVATTPTAQPRQRPRALAPNVADGSGARVPLRFRRPWWPGWHRARRAGPRACGPRGRPEGRQLLLAEDRKQPVRQCRRTLITVHRAAHLRLHCYTERDVPVVR